MSDARLEINDEAGRRTVPIEKDAFTIGRRTGNDLRLVGADISREHAEIARGGDGYLIRDRQSRFGTFVNNEQVAERALMHGDLIRLGQSGGVEMVFLSEAMAQTMVLEASAERTATSAGGELRQVATLLEGLRALGSARVLDEVLALVIDSAIDLSGAERGFIMLADAQGSLEFKLARARGHITLSGGTFETSRKIPEEVFTTGSVRMMADLLDGDLPAVHTGTIALGIRHVFCMPLRLVRYVDQADASAEEKRIGVLYLDSRERGTLASMAVRGALETLATEAAVAIENARLYREAMEKARMEHELRIAAEIQQALLPPPCWSAAHFAAVGRTVPCRAIGGDFFEYLTLADGSSGFVVADVSGKGAPAALLTAVIQGVLVTQTSYGGGPAAALARVNEVLIRRAIGSRFVTMFYAALTSDGRLTCCNAGHNPPFLISGSSVRRLSVGGLICGLFEHATYEEETVTLAPGDCLVIFSDGISEALNAAGEEFGDDRILACLTRGAGRGAAEMLDDLVATVKAFAAGTMQNDDMTAVVVRYGATG
ncbi:MAG TPA: SpoIIE family protein phosphatase [Vicinamibacterales bacterium]|jgi:serine phosphatase RsbU (regulator of sigma subunit)